VEDGKIIGFIGPNGAGKSTTIKLLLSQLKPDEGSSSIFGLDIIKDSAKIKEDLGYVPGEVRYYPDMRVGQLLDTTLRFHHKNPSDYLAIQKELCSIFDIDVSRKSKRFLWATIKQYLSISPACSTTNFSTKLFFFRPLM